MNSKNKVFHFPNQSLRDLAWTISSAPLIEKTVRNYFDSKIFFTETECENHFEKFQPVFNLIKKNPELLENFLQRKNSKLIGKRFEHLVEFWLENSKQTDLIAAGLQVFRKKRTIGEFDFIYFDKEKGEHIHLEVAGKFYIWNGKNSDYENFVSPNFKDNPKLKLSSLLNKQILLSQTKEGKEILEKLGVKNITPKICFKGYVFYPFNKRIENIFPKNHYFGYWLKFNEFNILEGKYWQILERGKWISPICCVKNFLTKKEITNKINLYFEKNYYPLLIVKLKRENKVLIEDERFFILKNSL